MSYSPIPPGIGMEWCGTIATIPQGWLHRNGSAISRTTFSFLFAAIGTQHGIGNGTTTFNLPDPRNKYLIGADADASCQARTTIEGSALQIGGCASHSHCFSGALSSHTHTFSASFSNTTDSGSANLNKSTNNADTNYDGSTSSFLTDVNDNGHTHSFSGSVSGTTDSATGCLTGTTSTNLAVPPYYATVFIIKT